MSEAQVHALEDLLRVKEKELHARREALLLKQSRRESRGDSFRYKLQELEDEQRKERALAEAFREAQQNARSDSASKEGQWLMRITALEDELRQKTEKVKALRTKEQELEAELRNRLHADAALLPALRLAASEMAAALQRHGPVAAVEALQSLSAHSSEPMPRGPTYPTSRPSVTVPPLPSCLVKDFAPDARLKQSMLQEVVAAPSDTPKDIASTERTPVSSQRSSRGGSDSKERWTTPVRRLDASLPEDAAGLSAVKTEPTPPLIQAKRLETQGVQGVQGAAVSPLTLPIGALGGRTTTSGTAASTAAGTMGTVGPMGPMGPLGPMGAMGATVAPATWRASSAPWTPGYQPQVAVAGRMSLPMRTVAPVAQGTGLGGLGFTPQTMPLMPGRGFA